VVPATTLKVAGIDLTSIGRFDAAPGDEAIVHEDQDARRYRKLVVSDGRLAGAILLGCGQAEAAEARTAITQQTELGPRLDGLRSGRLERVVA
jgi:nitrite reductase (NADH) large subunit